MQTPRQDKSSLNTLDVGVYVADWESKKLPHERAAEVPSFTYCGVDMFRPFYIKEKRSELKRYGVMFLFLASRAVRIEVTHQIDTDSFTQALQKMIGRRIVILIQSDNGSNFLGAENELKRVFLEMDNKKLVNFFKTRVLPGIHGKEIHQSGLRTKNLISKNNSFITTENP